MNDKFTKIIYNGLPCKVRVLFTFRFSRANYALAAFENDEYRIVKLGWDLFDGLEASDRVSREAVFIAQSIYNSACENRALLNGEHYRAEKAGESYRIKVVSSGLSIMRPAFKGLPAVVTMAASVYIALSLLLNYFKLPNDWIVMLGGLTRVRLIKTAAAVCIAALLPMVISIRKKRRNCGLYAAAGVAAPLMTAFAFSFIARPVMYAVIIAAAAAALAVYFFASCNKIRKLKSARLREIKVRKLFRRERRLVKSAVALIAVFAVVFGAFFPYARNRHTGGIAAGRIESRYDAACAALDEDSWSAMGKKDKINALQAIVDYEAVKNGTYSAKVIPGYLNYGFSSYVTYACYINDYNAIYIDADYMDSAADSVGYALHEFRHMMQHCIIEEDKADSEQAAAFKENYENYRSAEREGFDSYRSQLLEVDARWWSAKTIESYLDRFSENDIENSVFLSAADEDFILKNYESNELWSYAVCHSYISDDTSGDYISLGEYIGTGATEIEIPAEIDGLPVKALEDDLFKCIASQIETVTLPDGITGIGRDTFSDCVRLTVSVSPGNGCFFTEGGNMLIRKEDGMLLWVDKKSEGTVTIPAEVKGITACAFDKCSKITDIEVEPSNEYFFSENGLLYKKEINELAICPAGREGVVTLSEKTKSIRGEAFSFCDKITGVVIPASCEQIGGLAFYGCTGLVSLEIPATVKRIAPDTFYGLRNLEVLRISKQTVCGEYEGTDGEFIEKTLHLEYLHIKHIFYDGTKADWRGAKVRLSGVLDFDEPGGRTVTVHCSDGNITEKL